jgi:hypothetical protein
MLVARDDEVDNTPDNRQNERSEQPKPPGPLTGLAVIALAEDVIIHRRTPKSMLVCIYHDTSRHLSAPSAANRPDS